MRVFCPAPGLIPSLVTSLTLILPLTLILFFAQALHGRLALALAPDALAGLDLGAAEAKSGPDPFELTCAAFIGLSPAGKALVAAYLLGDAAPDSEEIRFVPADVDNDVRLLSKLCPSKPKEKIVDVLESTDGLEATGSAAKAGQAGLAPQCAALNARPGAGEAGAMLAWALAFGAAAEGGEENLLNFSQFKAKGSKVLARCAAEPEADLRDVVRAAYQR